MIEKARSANPISCPVMPLLCKDWENYPSGRRFERVTVVKKDGSVIRLGKTTDPTGSVEFTLTASSVLDAKALCAEFVGSDFGCVSCGPEDLKKLHDEMISLSERCYD